MVKLRHISLIESYILESNDLTLESKKDLEDLRSHLGEDLFNSYMKIRDKIADPEFKDFNKLKKMDLKDVQDFIDNFKSKSDKKKQDKSTGAKKLYEDSDWVVYKITSYPAAQLYGKGTKWCITGNYEGHEERGEEYFNDYIQDNNLDGGYYFYLNKKDPSEKYCILQTKDKEIHSIWDAEDENQGVSLDDLPDTVILPTVKEVNLKQYSLEQLCRAIDSYSYPSDVLYKMIDSFSTEDLNKYYKENTPLLYALMSGREDRMSIIEKLLDKGANVNLRSKYRQGYPPISLATINPKELEFLLYNSVGIDVDLQDNEGNTPLFYASCVNGNYDSTKLLLEFGADPNIRNNDGDSVLDKTLHPKRKELLLKYGAVQYLKV